MDIALFQQTGKNHDGVIETQSWVGMMNGFTKDLASNLTKTQGLPLGFVGLRNFIEHIKHRRW
jgi:hypothetical protein